jgi:hypothetical protein
MKNKHFILTLFVAVLFMLPSVAKAHPPMLSGMINGASATTVYATLTGQGAGYDPAIGLRVDHTTARLMDIVALHGSASVDLRKKYRASDGHTYSASAMLRFYWPGLHFPSLSCSYDPALYAAIGGTFAGYRTEFDSGIVWKKDAFHPTIGIGLDTESIDLELIYFLEEDDTPNRVQALSIGGSVSVYYGWKIMAELTGMRFLQAGERQTDTILTVGVGYEF